MTDAERKLWWHLRRLPVELTHFRRQATIGPYFADFACHERRLIIELDGGGHAQPAQAAADARRTAFLEARGYRVLRFWNNVVLTEIESVMEAIHDAVHNRQNSPPPLTPPRRSQGLAGGGEQLTRNSNSADNAQD